MSAHVRLHPPFWRHDWFTLHALRHLIDTAMARHLSALPPGCVVDVGAGDAPYAPLFECLGHDYLRCDLDGTPDVLITPEQPIPLPDGCADVVVSFQVLEHVWNLDWYLGECRRLLRPGGKMLLSTHGTWLYHPHPTDFRRWTCDGLKREVELRGFKVLEMLPAVGPLAWTTQFRALGYNDLLRRVPAIGPALSAPLCALMNARMVVEDCITPRSQRERNAAVYMVIAEPQTAEVTA